MRCVTDMLCELSAYVSDYLCVVWQISVVKGKVAGVRADIPAARQKLIHAGKVLKDDATLRSSGVAENDFIVCMLTKEVAPKVSCRLPPCLAGLRSLYPCRVSTARPRRSSHPGIGPCTCAGPCGGASCPGHQRRRSAGSPSW